MAIAIRAFLLASATLTLLKAAQEAAQAAQVSGLTS